MKNKLSQLAVAVALLGSLAFLAGCAEVETHNTKSLLSAAGFRVRSPETARQKEVYNHLQPYRMARATVNGRVFYVYKDEKAGVAYVGHEPEYQRYQQLCIQQRVAQDYYMAASMNSYYARGWYGAWGPRGVWW